MTADDTCWLSVCRRTLPQNAVWMQRMAPDETVLTFSSDNLCLYYPTAALLYNQASNRATLTGDTKINTHMEHIILNFSCVTVYDLHSDTGTMSKCSESRPAVSKSELMRYIKVIVSNFDLSCFLCGDWVLTPVQNDKAMLPSQISVIQISIMSELLIVMVFIAPCFDWLGTTQYYKAEYIWLMVL